MDTLQENYLRTILHFKQFVSALGNNTIEGKEGLSLSELLFLKRLAALDTNTINLTEMGAYLSLSKGGISHLITSLDKRGFVERITDPSNRRNILVSLTEKSNTRLALISKELDEAFEKMCETIGMEKIENMLSTLSAIMEYIK